LFLTAALTITTYVSGNDAQQELLESPDLPAALVSAHESAALVAFLFMQLTGFFAWLGLWLWRSAGRLAAWNAAVVLILAVISFGLMARAANMGGDIRHREIHAGTEASVADETQTLARSWGAYVEAHSWVWPSCETLHFVGLSLLFGVV